MEVEVVCSWCKISMGSKEFEFSAQEKVSHPITHSICSECFAKEMAKIEAMPINKNQRMKGVSP